MASETVSILRPRGAQDPIIPRGERRREGLTHQGARGSGHHRDSVDDPRREGMLREELRPRRSWTARASSREGRGQRVAARARCHEGSEDREVDKFKIGLRRGHQSEPGFPTRRPRASAAPRKSGETVTVPGHADPAQAQTQDRAIAPGAIRYGKAIAGRSSSASDRYRPLPAEFDGVFSLRFHAAHEGRSR